MREQSNLVIPRILARLLDLLLVTLLALLVGELIQNTPVSGLVALVLYHVCLITLGGNSLGRTLLRLRVRVFASSPKLRLLLREFILWLLFPLIILSLPFIRGPLWHDRLSSTEVDQNG